ncbi:diguanylate cyclase domain-containing protein [Pokkaliibacter sp. CJK22405]|uniref:diguanylate cyclase domain-containing protein n=1 Tax=Pokkaliibacter sp. CJK22405 TaxID=3384615 RepID=UPI0039852F45
MKRLPLVILITILIVLMTATSVSMVNQYRTARLVSNHIQYSAWSLAQMELELQKFYTNIALYDAGNIDHDKLMFSYDLLWNRLNVFLIGKENRTLRARFDAESKIRNLYTTLQNNEETITQLKADDQSSIRGLEKAFFPFLDQVRELVMMNFTGKESTKMYEGILASQKHMAWLLAGLFILTLALIYVLIRRVNLYGRLAHQDALTGVANRARLQDQLNELIHRAQPDMPYFALVMIKLNGFKELNQRLGHAQGDELLIKVAQRLREHIRSQDMVARLEQDSFAVILRQVRSEAEALEKARFFRQSLVFDYQMSGRQTQLDTRIGICIYPIHGTTPQELLSNGYKAQELARRATSDHVELYQQALADEAQRQRQLMMELREQLSFCDENSTLQLTYTPIESQSTGELKALRAHPVWHHPTQGSIDAYGILALTEPANLSQNLAHWVFERLTYDYHHSENPLPLHLDIQLDVPPSLLTPMLPSWVAQTLQRHVINASQLIVGFNERMFRDDVSRGIPIMNEMRAMGIRTQLYSTGESYDSLQMVANLPLDILMIEPRLSRESASQPRYHTVLSVFSEMADQLGIRLLAFATDDEGKPLPPTPGADLLQGTRFSKGESLDRVLSHYLSQPNSTLAPRNERLN